MTAREEIIQYLYEFLGSPKDYNGSQNIARYITSAMEHNELLGTNFVMDMLLKRIDTLTEELEKYISLNGKPPAIQISADTEEGKQLIKNLIEIQNKKS